MANLNKLNQIASKKSEWKKEAEERIENRAWQKHSQKIAIKVLKALREQKIKQKDLAEKIGVSPQQINKIVKGKENLTLQTIAKLENALNIELIFKENEKQNIVVTSFEKRPIAFITYQNRKNISKRQVKYALNKDYYQQNSNLETNYA